MGSSHKTENKKQLTNVLFWAGGLLLSYHLIRNRQNGMLMLFAVIGCIFVADSLVSDRHSFRDQFRGFMKKLGL